MTRPLTRPVDAVERAAVCEMCEWKVDDDGIYQTECGHTFIFTDDGPTENQQKFCGYCGKSLKAEPVRPLPSPPAQATAETREAESMRALYEASITDDAPDSQEAAPAQATPEVSAVDDNKVARPSSSEPVSPAVARYAEWYARWRTSNAEEVSPLTARVTPETRTPAAGWVPCGNCHGLGRLNIALGEQDTTVRVPPYNCPVCNGKGGERGEWK